MPSSPKPYFLEVTYRKGRIFAAYLHLPRLSGDVSARTTQPEPGFVVDFASDGRAIGIEITNPMPATLLPELNRVMAGLQLPPVAQADIQPLLAA